MCYVQKAGELVEWIKNRVKQQTHVKNENYCMKVSNNWVPQVEVGQARWNMMHAWGDKSSSMLIYAQKAGELVKGIKNRVKQQTHMSKMSESLSIGQQLGR